MCCLEVDLLTDLLIVVTVMVVSMGVGISAWSIIGTRKMKQSSRPTITVDGVPIDPASYGVGSIREYPVKNHWHQRFKEFLFPPMQIPFFLREPVSSGFPMPAVNPPREHCEITFEGFSIEPVNPDRFNFSDFQKTISRLAGVLSVMGISTIYNPVVSFPQYTFCKRSTGKEFVYQVNTHQEPVWMLSIVSDGLNDLLSSD